MTGEMVAAFVLVLLAGAHSVLGESGILRPLFAQAWDVGEPRWAIERILRFAWHLTSLAWMALAAVLLDASILGVVGLMALASAAIVFVMLRRHLAWPLFLLVALAAGRAEGVIDADVLQVGAVVTGVGLVGAALLHVYWALGGRWLLAVAVPEAGLDGKGRMPGPVLTLAVAAALFAFAALVLLPAFNVGPDAMRWLTWAGVGVLAIRAIGDGKTVGFTNTDRRSAFSQADDRWFSPLIVMLALGATGAALVG